MEASLASIFIGRLKGSLLFCIPFLSHHWSKTTLKHIEEAQHTTLYNSPDNQLIRLDAMCHCAHFPFPVFIHVNK